MGLWITAAKVGLVGFFVLGIMGTHGVGLKNGYFDIVDAIPKAAHPRLPGSGTSMKMDWTGIRKVDELLGMLLGVFVPMFDGRSPGLSVMSFHFFAQLYAIWTLILVEGYRVGNAWQIISFVTITGIIAENVAAAITFPAWCTLHLLVSPTVKASTSPATRQKSILVHPTELAALPYSVFLGAVVPVILAVVLPLEAKGAFYSTAQFWVLVRQFHPAATAVFQVLLSMFLGPWGPRYKTASERNRGVSNALARVYSIVKYTCIASHIGTLALVVGSQHLPGLFSVEAQANFEPLKMWTPPKFWTGDVPKVTTAADGLWTFLQWDSPVMTLSFLLWAFAINRDALWTRENGSGLLLALIRVAGMTAIGGPTAAAASLLQERDEVLLERLELPEPAKKDE